MELVKQLIKKELHAVEETMGRLETVYVQANVHEVSSEDVQPNVIMNASVHQVISCLYAAKSQFPNVITYDTLQYSVVVADLEAYKVQLLCQIKTLQNPYYVAVLEDDEFQVCDNDDQINEFIQEHHDSEHEPNLILYPVYCDSIEPDVKKTLSDITLEHYYDADELWVVKVAHGENEEFSSKRDAIERVKELIEEDGNDPDDISIEKREASEVFSIGGTTTWKVEL